MGKTAQSYIFFNKTFIVLMWIAVWCLSIRPALSERRDFCGINAFILFFSLCVIL